MDRYYLVKVTTNAPEHKLDSVDRQVLRNLWHGFDQRAEVSVLEDTAYLRLTGRVHTLRYDPVVDDGEEPPGYVPND